MSVDLKFQRKWRLFWSKGDPMAFARGPENILAIVSKILTRRSARRKHAAILDARTFSSFHIAVQRSLSANTRVVDDLALASPAKPSSRPNSPSDQNRKLPNRHVVAWARVSSAKAHNVREYRIPTSSRVNIRFAGEAPPSVARGAWGRDL